ncbi:MAG: DUF481 domain-containing protein, partial [Nannocystaceae bacterium]|nr:DUF481 domain-containing protein [Nannocystaceae bacterium]
TGPAGTATQDPATAGSTELGGQGQFGAASEKTEDMGDSLEFNLSFGSLISTGNAQQIAVTGTSTFVMRRGRHQGSAAVAGNYGQAASTVEDDLEPTVSNIQGRVRYDLFLARQWAVFAMATGRHDPFQGLDFRLNLDPGAAFYILPGADERLWVEAGYDFQFDARTPAATLARTDTGALLYDASGETIQLADKTRTNHAVRLFAGYFNKINEAVSFNTGVEFLQSVQVARRWRLNWNTALSTLVAKKLALAATFTVRVDNDPLPRVRKVDTITALNLVYRFF